MLLKRLHTGMLASNCYIFGDNGEGAIIDPGTSTDEIVNTVQGMELKIKYIILTHAHYDHIISVDEVREKTGAQVLIHEGDAVALTDHWLNGSALFGTKKAFKEADVILKGDEILEVGGLKLQVIHTPGHSPGGICILVENYLFTGDTLFKLSVGRTDLGNGDRRKLDQSLAKLMELSDDIVVYPGHGPESKIRYERNKNPFLK